MKLSIVRIACDGPDCPAPVPRQGQPGEFPEALRLRLRDVGWLSEDDRDICPTCVGRGYRP